ncbi:VHS1037 protein [Vibrio phage 1]|nr:VHS1037 protein [Vibrio phage 1]
MANILTFISIAVSAIFLLVTVGNVSLFVTAKLSDTTNGLSKAWRVSLEISNYVVMFCGVVTFSVALDQCLNVVKPWLISLGL